VKSGKICLVEEMLQTERASSCRNRPNCSNLQTVQLSCLSIRSGQRLPILLSSAAAAAAAAAALLCKSETPMRDTAQHGRGPGNTMRYNFYVLTMIAAYLPTGMSPLGTLPQTPCDCLAAERTSPNYRSVTLASNFCCSYENSLLHPWPQQPWPRTVFKLQTPG